MSTFVVLRQVPAYEGMLRFAVQKTADVRSRSSLQVVDFLLRCRGLFPWSCCSADHRVSPVAPVHVVDVPVMQVVQLPRWFAVLGHADDMPVVGNNRCLELDSVENCRVPQLQFFDGRRFPRRVWPSQSRQCSHPWSSHRCNSWYGMLTCSLLGNVWPSWSRQCRCPWRSHRCCSWTRMWACLLLCQTVLWSRRARCDVVRWRKCLS